MINILRGGFKNLAALFLVVLSVSGCKTYGSSFGCPDAPGASCLPMDAVDRLIASGEIERYDGSIDKKKCRGKKCAEAGAAFAPFAGKAAPPVFIPAYGQHTVSRAAGQSEARGDAGVEERVEGKNKPGDNL